MTSRAKIHPTVEYLTQMRRLMSLTQQDIADRIGWTRAAVASWEAGTRMPPLDALDAYAAVFGTYVALTDQPQIPIGHKLCTRCKEPKPLEEFTKDKRRPDGRGSHCKDCDSEYQLDRYYARKGASVA